MGLLHESVATAGVKQKVDAKAAIIKESCATFDSNKIYKEKYSDLSNLLESENPSEQYRGALTVRMMEQQRAFIENSKNAWGESTVQASLGQLNKITMDVVRIFYPNQIAQDIVDIQPLAGSIGQVFVIKPRYSDTFNGVTAKDEMFKNHTTDYNYASEEKTSFVVGTSDADDVTFTATLSPAKIRPGTLVITVEGQAATNGVDNGIAGQTTGTISGTGIASGTINYVTGAISVTTSVTPGNTKRVLASYYYHSDENESQIRSVEFDLSLIPVQAKAHPLKFKYSVEAGLALDAHLSVNTEDTLTVLAANFIKEERDQKLVKLINDNAIASSTLNFDASTSGIGYSKRDFYSEIGIKVGQGENLIQAANGRGGVSFILCGQNAANIFEQSLDFKPEPKSPKVGAYKIGTIRDGSVAVIKSLRMNANTYIVGFKGFQFGDSATILAEWVPIYFTPTLQQPTLTNEKGLMSLYDLFVNNAGYYYKGTISNYGA